MKPYFEEDGIVIYHADCREVLSSLEPVDLVLTDPPYGRNLETGNHGAIPGFSIKGDEDVSLRDEVLSRFNNLSAVVFGSPYCPRPKNIRAILIWNKGQHVGMGDLSFPWKPTHEEIYVIGEAFKSDRRDGSVIYFPAVGGCVGNRNDGFRFHPVEKPTDLLGYLILRTTGLWILDPFMGSGSTLVAAKNLGRKAIGIEIHEPYCEVAAKRLSQKVLNFSA